MLNDEVFMSVHRYLTKSRFKSATECPTKLFYTGKSEYANQNMDDAFLASLAKGGYQVGELAKCYYPNGVLVQELDHDVAHKKTCDLLQQHSVTIFEAAICVGNLFVRIDILVKQGNNFELIEVKAKSYKKEDDKDFLNSKGGIVTAWKPYVFDVAFQKYVLQQAYPTAVISSFLYLMDKNAKCPTNGLNQKFLVAKDTSNRNGVRIDALLNQADLAVPLLTKVRVDSAIYVAYERELTEGMPAASFVENIKLLAELYCSNKKISPAISSKCKRCEFKCTPVDEVNGLKSGFVECWQEQLHWTPQEISEPNVLNIWNYRGVDKSIEQGVIKLTDVTFNQLAVKESNEPALTSTERQWLQVEKYQKRDATPYLDRDSIVKEISQWRYPLHFIDFETSAVAIPFYEGMSPYEGIAFQFSHHQVHQDGRIEHVGQFLHVAPGEFPNFAFVRELKQQLGNDSGTIFRYSAHENSYLNAIRMQLLSSAEPDKKELCGFIESITKSTEGNKSSWHGSRCMVDLLELVKQYYYDPATNGSNSIKYVLPAMLNSSEYLQQKYSRPVYGTAAIPSLNFAEHIWVKIADDGKVIDPYKSLPKMFQDLSSHDIELLSAEDEINNGGMALTAYAKLQFTQMSDYERSELQKALLKYCELDTLAMVMIYEGWLAMIDES